MPTSPQRRARIRQAHQLRQHGHTLRSIAQQLNVSHSTIAEDLKRFETHRSEITAHVNHDLQLEHTLQLRDRLHHLYAQDPLHPLQRYPLTDAQGSQKTRAAEASNSEIIRLYSLHQRAVAQAEREYRHALQHLAHADIQTTTDTIDYPDDQLAAAAQPAQPRTTPTKPEHAKPTRPTAKPTKPAQTQPNHPRHSRPNLNNPEQHRPPPNNPNPSSPTPSSAS